MPEENSESGSSASGASDLKDRGNKAFADGDFVTAEQFYRDAISVDDTSHILYTNLAAALLSQSKFHEALDATNEAIRLDHTWLKAHFRKATALESLGRLRESFEGRYSNL
jgi:tetratricopeptide (TPR) repeat protein